MHLHDQQQRASTTSSSVRWQVMKAGTSEAQRRRLVEGGLVVKMDARSQRLLRYEEQGTRGAASLDGHCWGERDAVEARAHTGCGRSTHGQACVAQQPGRRVAPLSTRFS